MPVVFIPVTVLVGDDGVVMVQAGPLNCDHAPVPTLAVLPASVMLVPHVFWSGPAFAVVGAAARTMLTWSVLLVQPALLMVHWNT